MNAPAPEVFWFAFVFIAGVLSYCAGFCKGSEYGRSDLASCIADKEAEQKAAELQIKEMESREGYLP